MKDPVKWLIRICVMALALWLGIYSTAIWFFEGDGSGKSISMGMAFFFTKAMVSIALLCHLERSKEKI